MKNMIRILALGALTMGLIACSKSEHKKAVVDPKAEHAKLVEELETMGLPNIYWSEEDVDAYDQKLQRLALLNKTLEASKSDAAKHPNYIEFRQNRVVEIRNALVANRTATENAKRYEELKARASELEASLAEMGTPVSAWSVEQLDQYTQMAQELDSNYAERLAIINGPYPAVKNLERERQDISINKEVFSGRALSVDFIRMEKASNTSDEVVDTTSEEAVETEVAAEGA